MFLALPILALFVSGPLAAQQAYGRVWVNQDGQVLMAVGATVELRCPSGDASAQWMGTAVSDNGTYRTSLSSQGQCDVRVAFRNKTSTTVQVFFSRESSAANLELMPSEQGWQLRRR